MIYWNKSVVVTLPCFHAYLKCENLQRNKAIFFVLLFKQGWSVYRNTQAVFMFSQVNYNIMGETTGVLCIIAPVKIIYHLSTTPIRELRIFTVFVIVWKENLTKYMNISAKFRCAWIQFVFQAFFFLILSYSFLINRQVIFCKLLRNLKTKFQLTSMILTPLDRQKKVFNVFFRSQSQFQCINYQVICLQVSVNITMIKQGKRGKGCNSDLRKSIHLDQQDWIISAELL